MKNFKQPLLTIFVIFATAYILTIMGCSSSSSAAPAPGPNQVIEEGPAPIQNEDAVLQPLDPNHIRECTNNEFENLQNWAGLLDAAKTSIENFGPRSAWKKNKMVVDQSLAAINKCDQLQAYHSLKPCKKSKRVITAPDRVEQRAYGPFEIKTRCQLVEDYLLKFNLRPDRAQARPEPPAAPQPPVPNQPGLGNDGDSLQLRQCSNDEFSKLNSWRSTLDLAQKNISRLGSPSNWKYDAVVLDAAKTATSSCESLIKYHQSTPCKREKAYTAESLREQCKTARTYFYNYAQRTESLITPNAKLYLNTDALSNRNFNPGPDNFSLGQCVVTNQSSATIAYSGQKTLVTEARVYTDELQMFVLVTQEGLKLECYGLNFSSAATSLTEVMRLLAEKETRLQLSYELN